MLKVWLAGLALVCLVLGGALFLYGLDKVGFVGRCMKNGRQYSACACTHNALRELPQTYADLSVSWAHDPSDAYARNVVGTVGCETTRLLINVCALRQPRYERTTSIWEAARDALLKSAAGQVLALWLPSVFGVPTGVVVSAADVGKDFVKAQMVMSRHCGGSLNTMMTATEQAYREATETASGWGRKFNEAWDGLLGTKREAPGK